MFKLIGKEINAIVVNLVLVCSGVGAPECVIIREVYENDDSLEDFEVELDRALDAEAKTIVIEPAKLGEETARWIRLGNWLHKSAVISGSICLIGGYIDADTFRDKVYVSLGLVSVVCSGVYTISWQTDPCCKYQVEDNVPKIEKLLNNLSSTNPVVLVRRDDSRRKILHSIVALFAGLYCAWKTYKWLRPK